MNRLTCELCGSANLRKENGEFVCQNCGAKYSVEEARKMMGVTEEEVRAMASAADAPTVVRVDNSDELQNLYQIARRARDDDNAENAAKYYDMILVKDPMSWEAAFYTVYYKAMQCKIGEISSAANSVNNCFNTVMGLIWDYVKGDEEREAAVLEVSNRCITIANLLYIASLNHYSGIDASIRDNYSGELLSRIRAAMGLAYNVGNTIEEKFGTDREKLRDCCVKAWEAGITIHTVVYRWTLIRDRDQERNKIQDYVKKIQKYKPDYSMPELEIKTTASSSVGCYVATAVYGSYDCPEVWTLRRYRDQYLAERAAGRAFIRLYYAVSPTLVRHFGQTRWFRSLWRGKLDRMVARLRAEGYESTPYQDRDWN